MRSTISTRNEMALKLFVFKLTSKIPLQIRTTTTFKSNIRKLFGKYLIFTNTLSSGILMAGGDLIQQEIEYYQKILPQRYEWDRVGRMLTVGLIQGTPQHWFYKYLDRWLPGTAMTTIAKKIVIDQLIASTFCIVLFFTGMGLLEGKSISGCVDELNHKFLTVYVTDWCVWPPAQFVNFYFIPGRFRVLYINGVTMLYNIFLSYIKHVDYPHDQRGKNKNIEQ